MTVLNDVKLKALSYLDYLNRKKEDVDRIRYVGTDSAYRIANEIIWHIIDRYVSENSLTRENYHEQENGNMLRLDKSDLDSNYNEGGKKGKEAVINKFKENLQWTLDRIINDLTRTGKSK